MTCLFLQYSVSQSTAPSASRDIGEKMSLPGLELTQPSEERHLAVAPPSQIALKAGSEWRFEVAFGHIVRVKVRFTFFTLTYLTEGESQFVNIESLTLTAL